VDVCPEAVASEARTARQIKRLVAEAVDDLIRWSVVEALPPSVAGATYGGPKKAIPDSRIRIPNRRAGPLPLVQDSNLVEKYSANIW
jgi:hypothetical protein